MSLRKYGEPAAVISAIILVVAFSALTSKQGGRAEPVLEPDEIGVLYQSFDWSQEGVPLEPGSPAAAVANFVCSLREARWGDAASLVVPALRGTRDRTYFEARFGPVVSQLDRWLVLKQELSGDSGRFEVATSYGGEADEKAILWVVYTTKSNDKWYATGMMKPLNEIQLVQDWSTLSSEHFRVHYAGGQAAAPRATASRVRDGLEQLYARLSETFGVDIEVVDVYLAQDRAKIASAVGPGVSPSVAGFAGASIVLLATPSTDPYSLDTTAGHELVHMFVASLVDGRSVPLWFNEGLAVYMSNQKPQDIDLACRTARTGGASVTHLFASEGRQPYNDYDYTLSWAAVQHIEVTFGSGTCAELLRQVQKGSSWEEAVETVTGYDKKSFYRLLDSHLQNLCAELGM